MSNITSYSGFFERHFGRPKAGRMFRSNSEEVQRGRTSSSLHPSLSALKKVSCDRYGDAATTPSESVCAFGLLRLPYTVNYRDLERHMSSPYSRIP